MGGLPGLFPLFDGIVERFQLAVETVGGRLGQRVKLLMSNISVHDGLAKSIHLCGLIDEHAIQALLDVIDDIWVLNIGHLSIAVEGLEGRQNLFCLVSEVNDVGFVFAWEGAIQPR